MTIYVGNLSYQVTEAEVKEAVSGYGTVKQVELPIDRTTGRMLGFGFVEIQTETEEDSAVEKRDGAEGMDRTLNVNKARPREERKPSNGGWGNNRNFSRGY